ncbi:efflux RND transporter periplasmic adaptor subunit [Ekhidna sp.]|uniref:efflux RND transporter periplasmic adaptor subunit n=1 Tax=Ekhidna sp. TaxID=2608089 RepID=UPI003B51257E
MKATHLLTFYALILSCSTPQKEGQQLNPSALVSADTIEVVSYISRFEKLTYPVKNIGKIRSATRSNLIFERSGILESIHVNNGEYVRKGQTIAKLRNASELIQKENAIVALKKALVNYENEMLALGDSLYYKEKWSRVKENVQLNTGVLAAKVNLKQAELAYQQTIIKAPLTGIVEGIKIQPGDYVSVNQLIGSIYDPSSFEVVCDVLEYDVLKMKKGMQAKIFPLASSELELSGSIAEVNPSVDSKGLAQVIINISQAENIIPGLSARVEVNVTDQPTVVIPLQAVVKRSERHVVFNIDNGLAKWNYVTLGKDNGEKVQILDGIEQDMEIIISNNLQLAHDSPVMKGM